MMLLRQKLRSRSPSQTKILPISTMTSTDEYVVSIPCGGNDSPEQATELLL